VFRFVKKFIAMEVAELLCMIDQYSVAMKEDDDVKPKFGFSIPDASIIDKSSV
jgi:hypothetical protein